MIYGLGMLESGLTFDYGQLVLDAEFARMIKHVLAGFTVCDETLAVNVIREHASAGSFLTAPHTLNGMREQSFPRLIDRTVRDAWERGGALDIRIKAANRARQILDSHYPEAPPPDVRKAIRAIVADAEKKMGITR